MKLVIATKNKGKIAEIRDRLRHLEEVEVVSLAEYPDAPDVVEDGATFMENAAKKARAIALYTGLTALADDSGLVVDALGGAPGVYSARFGGEGATDDDRNRLLLEKLRGVPGEKRTARFVCVIAIAAPDGRVLFAEGACEGRIAGEMRGEHGFGYDPVFYLPEKGRMMAELPLREKNTISHRARALDGAASALVSLISDKKP
jgi:XTP/dITP diphosphohydrolase